MKPLFVAILWILYLLPPYPLTAQEGGRFSGRSAPVYLLVDPKDAQTPWTEDFEDFFAFADSYGKKRGEVGFNSRADTDGDGDVDYDDFFAFADAFGRVAAPEQRNLIAVSGRVTDPDGRPVEGAFVALSDSVTQAGTQTNSGGDFGLSVPPGVYRLRVDLPQGSDLMAKEITLEVPLKNALDLTLERGTGMDLFLIWGGRRKRTLPGIQPGATVSVEVAALSGAAGATGFTARLEFDPQKLTCVGLNTGDLIPGLQALSYLSDGGVEIGGAVFGGGPGATRDGGTLATVQFQANPSLPGTASLTLVSASLKKGDRQERFTPRQSVSVETVVKRRITY